MAPAGDQPMTEEEAHAAELEAGRKLFAGPCGFVAAAATIGQLPEGEVPEVAFAGRSNVGKSSLVNALTGRRTLARTSDTPGRTQQLIFFLLAERLLLVDLPGYGYAQASKSAARGWAALTRAYLRGRPQLRRVLLLVDARHGLKPLDRERMQDLDRAAVSYQLVFTKADKLKGEEREARLATTRQELSQHLAAHPQLLLTSAVTGEGVAELRAALAALARPKDGG